MRLRKQVFHECYDSILLIIAVFVTLAIAGCAAGQFAGNPIPETPKGKYITARKFYNDQLEALTVYGTVLTAEDKAGMKAKLDPVLDSIETLLDGWKIALMDPAKDASTYDGAWIKLRSKMVGIIAKYLDDD